MKLILSDDERINNFKWQSEHLLRWFIENEERKELVLFMSLQLNKWICIWNDMNFENVLRLR